MINDIKFAIFNVLTAKGISTPEIVDMITAYDIKESFFTTYSAGEEYKIQRWVCKNGKHTEIKTWYRNGILRSWSILYNKRLNGFLIEWYESGILSKRFYYTHGALRLDMTNTMWYENGNLAILKEPKLHRSWFPNGKLSSYIELNEIGEKNGFYVNFDTIFQKYPNIKYYKNNQEISSDNIQWRDGLILDKLESCIVDIDTNQYHIDIKKNRTKTILEYYYKNGKKHGKFYDFHYDGSLASITWYNNGLKHGSYTAWYISHGSSLKTYGSYYEDQKNGEWRVYSQNGVLTDIIQYDKGIKKIHTFLDLSYLSI